MKKPFLKLFIFVFCFVIFLLFSATVRAAGPTEVISNITTPTTWTREDSPYIIRNMIFVESELTIEPGAIIKFDSAGILNIYQQFSAIGTEEDKIIFTSIKDDAFGGDTNHDGTSTQPLKGDWQYIYFYGGPPSIMEYCVVSYGSINGVVMGAVTIAAKDNLTIRNSEIKHSGYSGIFIYNSQPTIENNTITDNNVGVFAWSSAVPTIVNNSIFGNSLGAFAYAGNSLNAINNWWGHESGPYHLTLNPDGLGDRVSDRVLFDPWVGKIVNQPPIIESFNQYKSDGITELYSQEITAGDSMVFKAVVSDPDGDKVKIEVELKEYSIIPGSEFDGLNTRESDFVDSGEETSTTFSNLINSNYHWRLRVIDEQGAVSDWQYVYPDSELDPDFNFIVKKALLYTQVESNYPPRLPEDEWAEEDYINGATTYSCASGTRATISKCGCAITSVIMMLRYHGITEDVDGGDINPGAINEWLKTAHDYDGDQITGYYNNGNLSWDAIPEYSRAPTGSVQPGLQQIVKRGIINGNPGTLANTLDEDLENYQPVILKTRIAYQNGRYGDHFILTPEKFTSTYRVNDPYWYNTKNLNHTVTGIGYEKNYYNYYTGLRRFAYLGNTYDTRPVHYAGITQTIASPAELLITAPNGQKLGFDPINNTGYNEIVGGTYTSEGIGDPEGVNPEETHKTKTIWIPDPELGEYQLRVIGTGEGVYTLYSHITDNSGRPQADDFTSNILAGEVFEYALDYDKENIDNSDIIIIDETPPEASVYFDANLEKLTIVGIDNITATPIVAVEENCIKKIWKKCVKKEYIYTISDEAGNTLKLWLEKFKHKRKILARIKKIQYNNDEKINTRAVLTYIWKKKNNNVKFLSQTVGSHREFIIHGIYKQHKSNTKIWGYDWEENKRIKETKDGLVIIKLNTDEGMVDYEY